MCIFVYGAVTLYRAPFQTLPLTHTLIQPKPVGLRRRRGCRVLVSKLSTRLSAERSWKGRR